MRAFFGGQIVEGKRGNLATIVSRENLGNKKAPVYSVISCPIDSEDFIHVTGVMDVNYIIERAYIGVSPEIDRKITRELSGMGANENALRRVDMDVVTPFLLDKYPNGQKRIVLKSTPEGYIEVKEKE